MPGVWVNIPRTGSCQEGTIVTELKLAQYIGYLDQGKVNFAYGFTDQDVFFTGIQIMRDSSTARCAAAVVNAIVIDAGIHWQDHEFYDVQTHQGYPGCQPGWCTINRLVIQGHGDVIVHISLKTVAVATTDAAKNQKILEAIPEEFRDAFLARIG